MATLKVGQRVRFARAVKPAGDSLPGREGVIAGLGAKFPERSDTPWDCYVNFGPGEYRAVNCMFSELEPLLDPKADEFIERLKKLKPYDEPKVEPAREWSHTAGDQSR